jgi:hypothetical protein
VRDASGDSDVRDSDVSDSDVRDSDVSDSDVRDSDVRDSDSSGDMADYPCFPTWFLFSFKSENSMFKPQRQPICQAKYMQRCSIAYLPGKWRGRG